MSTEAVPPQVLGAPDLLGQDLEMGLLRALSPFLASRTFVDVGAERGGLAAAMMNLGMHGVLFEPLPRHFASLSRLVRERGGAAYPYAIDEHDGEREFFVATDQQGNELDYYHSLQRMEDDRKFHHSRQMRVRCRSIASLVAEGVLPNAVGVLKTDTEGNDLAVLKGLGSLRPELIVCEYFTEGIYAGWESARPDLAIALLAPLGYVRYVAIKRIEEFEYCVASPAGFLPRQWGNLFFVSDALYARGEPAIARFLGQAEETFIGRMRSICADRVAKEAVIQDLLAERRTREGH